MSHLLPGLAPISAESWQLIDDEARERLSPGLGARRLVDFSGPHGWRFAAVSLGRVGALGEPAGEGIDARLRRVQPLVEVVVPFGLDREELRAGDRGAADVDLVPLDEAAQRLVRLENRAVFHGWPAAGIVGIVEGCPHPPLAHAGDQESFVAVVASGVELLLRQGIGGPYGLALGEEMWRLVAQGSDPGGYPLLRHLEGLIGGPTVWTPGLEQAVLVSLRGGDFRFDCGEDISVGYRSHDSALVTLYLEETFTFRAVTPEASLALTATPTSAPRRRGARR